MIQLLLLLASLFLLTTAVPNASKTLSRVLIAPPADSDTVRITVCSDINWGGTCQDIYTTTGGGPDRCKTLDGTASSIGPMEGIRCVFYRTGYCDDVPGSSGGMLELTFPGMGNLFAVPEQEYANWNDAALSFQCFRE